MYILYIYYIYVIYYMIYNYNGKHINLKMSNSLLHLASMP